MLGAISQIEINQTLVRYSHLFRHRLKVANDIPSKTDCHLLLERLGIWIAPPFKFGQIVFSSHGFPPHSVQFPSWSLCEPGWFPWSSHSPQSNGTPPKLLIDGSILTWEIHPHSVSDPGREIESRFHPKRPFLPLQKKSYAFSCWARSCFHPRKT